MYCMHVHTPVKDYLVHLPVLKLGGGVLLRVSALLPNPPVVLEFILLGMRGRVVFLKEPSNNGKLGCRYTIV